MPMTLLLGLGWPALLLACLLWTDAAALIPVMCGAALAAGASRLEK